MAIGLALMFNIKLPINFNSPYKALDIQDFWHRWHITLSRFLRDYIYIPLGGNREGRCRTYINLMIVFLIGGLIAIPLALLFPPVSTILGYILNDCYHVIFSGADFFAHTPLIVPKTPLQRGVFAAAAFAIGIFLTTAAYFRNKKVMQHLPCLT